MTAHLFIWAPTDGKWMLKDILPNEEEAKKAGRVLWKAGAHGIKIDVTTTVVEEIRK